MKKYITTHTIAASIIGLIVGVGAGWLGHTGLSQVMREQRFGAGNGQFTQGAGQGARGLNNMRGGGFVSGEISSKDTTSLTVKAPDGSSKIVLLGPSAQVTKSAPGSADDLSVGTNVLITGTTNSDQSITAQTIQIRPPSTSQR